MNEAFSSKIKFRSFHLIWKDLKGFWKINKKREKNFIIRFSFRAPYVRQKFHIFTLIFLNMQNELRPLNKKASDYILKRSRNSRLLFCSSQISCLFSFSWSMSFSRFISISCLLASFDSTLLSSSLFLFWSQRRRAAIKEE